MKARQWPLYAMLLPSLVFLAIFIYSPMYGLSLAFKAFAISKGFGSPWARPLFANFYWLADSEFWNVFLNTIKIASLKFVTGFPAPIVLALLINEVRHAKFKKTIQTLVYLPHFISWVIFSGIVYRILDPAGPVGGFLAGTNSAGLLGQDQSFVAVLLVSNLIKEAGWGTIIYLAAISGLDPQLYDAASIDGAGQWQKMKHITLPGLVPVISVLLILAIPGVLSAGFDQIWNMSNAMVARSANILDIYIVKIGIQGGQFSQGIAMGFMVNALGLGLVILTNKLSKRSFGYGAF